MNLNRTRLLLGLAVLLQACASVPPSKPIENEVSQASYQQHLQNLAVIDQFKLKGRIGVQSNGEGFSGSLNWQHNNLNDDISLYSPFGGQVASIKKTAGKVTLEDEKGNSVSASDAETLTQTVLGWKLPLAGLADWVLGRPANGEVQSLTLNEYGYLTSLKQDEWDIEYQNYSNQNGHFLPNKILLKSKKVNLKLLIEQWDVVIKEHKK
ncbi:MAG: lipoprotein insertase outer membrane protein LolB [Methylotenera sp.]|nr:lipoprotein insertase outer membrane protein LolB [Methylotenera sp.]